MTTQSTALQIRQAQDLQGVQTSSAPVTLDRDNLQFFANMIEAAGLLPQEKENGRDMPPVKLKARVMAKIVGGQVYGFDPIQSQENLHIIGGKITLSARGLSQLLHRSGKYSTRIERLDQSGCKLAVLERNSQGEQKLIGHVEFTKEMAEKAKLTGNQNYQKFAEDMYFARCISRVVKRFAPEVLDGQAVQYDLAKREPEVVTAAPTAPPQLSEPAAEKQVGETYEDAEYSGIADSLQAEEIEGEFTPAEADESTEALRKAAHEAIARVSPEEAKKLLKGRQIDMMETDALQVLLGELPTF